jgi:hypothetical protein
MAFGITATGSSLGGIVFPIMVRFLLPSVGFKWTARTIAFVIAFFLTTGFIVSGTIQRQIAEPTHVLIFFRYFITLSAPKLAYHPDL